MSSTRRHSLHLYETECPALPRLDRRPLRVPRNFDYLPLRAHFDKVVAWMITKVARRDTAVGPIIRYDPPPKRYHPPLKRDVTSGTPVTVRFLKRVRAAQFPERRVGVAFLSYRDNIESGRSGHRSVVICDARTDALILHVIDPNGAHPYEKRAEDVLWYHFGTNATVNFLTIPKLNAGASANAWDATLGIRATDPEGYCVYVSLLLVMDLLCTGTRVFTGGHFERLSTDMVGRSRGDEALDRYNRLMAMRSFTYEILRAMKRSGAWTGYVPEVSQTYDYYPESTLAA